MPYVRIIVININSCNENIKQIFASPAVSTTEKIAYDLEIEIV